MTENTTTGTSREPIAVIAGSGREPDKALIVTLSSGQMLRGFIDPRTAAEKWLHLRSVEAIENRYLVHEYVELTINADHIASIVQEVEEPRAGYANWDEPWHMRYRAH